jgi:DNA adenine methylase
LISIKKHCTTLGSRWWCKVPRIKSPLRYPGGKSRVVDAILERFPEEFAEFREPFVGGGSVFLAVRQQYPKIPVWINDLNTDLVCFWRVLQNNHQELCKAISDVRQTEKDGAALFERLRSSLQENISEFERAVRFFVLNRITFSGTVDSGGYSQQSFEGRFTNSSIERLELVVPLLQNVTITNTDYREILQADGKDVFMFLDPPYYSATQSRLYGKNGHLHLQFDHAEFARAMQQCQHQWLVTYDDCTEIRNSFKFAQLEDFTVQYGMNNYKQGKADRGAELFISSQKYIAQDELFV